MKYANSFSTPGQVLLSRDLFSLNPDKLQNELIYNVMPIFVTLFRLNNRERKEYLLLWYSEFLHKEMEGLLVKLWHAKEISFL
jgi:hypothetical protein